MIGQSILVVEDEVRIRELMQFFLQKRGYDVLTAENGYQAIDIVKKKNPNIILLDTEMPVMDGFEVCKNIRKQSKAPILFVSCKKEIGDKIKAFNIGGDDYITKPFDLHELDARIQVILRRNEWMSEKEKDEEQSVLSFSELKIYIDRCELFMNGEQVKLLNKEFQILSLMAKYPNKIWSAEQLYNQVWGFYSDGTPQTVKVHISNLRRKLEKNPSKPKYIQTVRGFGYKFVSN